MASKREEIKQARKNRFNWTVTIGLLVAVGLLSFPTLGYFNLDTLKVGRTSPRTYSAPRDYHLVNPLLTRQKKKKKLRSVYPEFIQSRQLTANILEDIETTISRLRENKVKKYKKTELPRTAEDWARFQEVSLLLAKFILRQGVVKTKSVFSLFKNQDYGYLKRYISTGGNGKIKTKREKVKLSEFKNKILEIESIDNQTVIVIKNLYPGYTYSEAVKKILVDNLHPNIVFKKGKFKQAKEKALKNFEPVYTSVKKGEVILKPGDKVTSQKYELLQRINESNISYHVWTVLTNLFLTCLGIFIIYLYSENFYPEFLDQPNKIGLLSLLVVLTVVLGKLLQLMLPDLPGSFEFFFPFAAIPILLTILLDFYLALLVVPFLALLLVSFFGFSFELMTMFILGGLTGVFSTRRVEQRTALLHSGLYLGGVQLVAVVLYYAFGLPHFFSVELGKVAFWAALNGSVAVPFIVIGSMPFLENGFNITTNFKLQELADLNNPLLRKLFREAPGSYQHSIILSNLCEQAARSIGANPLLTRVGAYYHDIGKAENPEYFTENQRGEDNPHDELKPTLSASILKSHVKKGVELAEEEGLPEEIIDFIEQHQGTTRMQYFYHQALESGEEVNEDEFRYPGPIPQFREVAILMLGDSVEAAARSLEAPNSKNIKDKVEDVVYTRFKEGQLNRCKLTLEDLDTIVRVFTRVLTSIYHKRISYPSEDDTNRLEKMVEENGGNNGD